MDVGKTDSTERPVKKQAQWPDKTWQWLGVWSTWGESVGERAYGFMM